MSHSFNAVEKANQDAMMEHDSGGLLQVDSTGSQEKPHSGYQTGLISRAKHETEGASN